MLSINTKLNETNNIKNKSSPINVPSTGLPLRKVSSETFNPNFSSSPPDNSSFIRKLEKRLKTFN